MSDTLGPITLGKKQDQVFLGRDLGRDRDYSEEIAKAIDQEIRKTIDDCYQRAQDILEKESSKLERIAQALLERETIDATEIKALVEGRELPPLGEDDSDTDQDLDSDQDDQADSEEKGSSESRDKTSDEGFDSEHEKEGSDAATEAGHVDSEASEEDVSEEEKSKENRRASFHQQAEQKDNPE